MPKLLIILGIILVAVGLAWMAGERLGLGRLPERLRCPPEAFR